MNTDKRTHRATGNFDSRTALTAAICALKDAQGHTFKDIARKTGVSESTVTRILKGDNSCSADEYAPRTGFELRQKLDSLWPVPPSILEKHNATAQN